MTSSNQQKQPYDFSAKYNEIHAHAYFHKHRHGLWRKLSHWREQQVCARALQLAGNPASVLDIPCGTGRFWELLCKDPARKLYAADNSRDMMNLALKYRPPAISSRFQTCQASVFDLKFADNFVENVFCIRLLHHMKTHENRIRLLQEAARVASNSVIVSLWVDGNYKAWRRQKLEAKRGLKNSGNRFVLAAAIFEDEIAQAGMQITAKLDFLPRYALWRTYVLKVN
ncbi:MAG: class I SAM-dependent methyltransferase [gamma proteobacterium symbiont of Bathyaustriella thionipta]|nr:class I SAM-dependent methyltransferase [gamma proteobacterium symbiont of Bathyaustriella thionipta]